MSKSEQVITLHQQGFSQRQIAKELGVSQVAICKRLRRLGLRASEADNLSPLTPTEPDSLHETLDVSPCTAGADTPVLDGGPLQESPSVNVQSLDTHGHQKALALLRTVGEELTRTGQREWGAMIVFATDVLTGKRVWGDN